MPGFYKKILKIFLVFGLAMMLTGCANNSNSELSDDAEAETDISSHSNTQSRYLANSLDASSMRDEDY